MDRSPRIIANQLYNEHRATTSSNIMDISHHAESTLRNTDLSHNVARLPHINMLPHSNESPHNNTIRINKIPTLYTNTRWSLSPTSKAHLIANKLTNEVQHCIYINSNMLDTTNGTKYDIHSNNPNKNLDHTEGGK